MIVVKRKKETVKDDFRKLIPDIIQKEKSFVESLETRKNGQIVNFKYSVIKQYGLYFFIDPNVDINRFIKIDIDSFSSLL